VAGGILVELLNSTHNLQYFECGEPSLDNWLRSSALRNQRSGDSRTYVCVINGEIAGFYAICTAAARRSDLPGDLRRNAPDPVPMMLIAQLAVGSRHRGTGLGERLLSDALRRLARLSAEVGFRAVATHPIDAEVQGFYARFRFKLVPDAQPPLMVLPLHKLLAAIAAEG